MLFYYQCLLFNIYTIFMRLIVNIPAYNEEKCIGECIDCAVHNSGGRFFEIIVVDNASTDKTREVAEKKDVRVITETRKGVQFARERLEGLYLTIIADGKSAAYVEYLYLMSARLGFFHYGGRELECLHVIFEIIALASDVKTDALYDKPGFKCLYYKIDRLARMRSEFR